MSGEAFGMKPSPDGSHDDGPDDPFQSVEWERYAAHARATLTPMLKDSSVGVVMTGDHDPDPKQAMELGVTNPDAVATFQEWLDGSMTIHVTMEGQPRVTS